MAINGTITLASGEIRPAHVATSANGHGVRYVTAAGVARWADGRQAATFTASSWLEDVDTAHELAQWEADSRGDTTYDTEYSTDEEIRAAAHRIGHAVECVEYAMTLVVENFIEAGDPEPVGRALLTYALEYCEDGLISCSERCAAAVIDEALAENFARDEIAADVDAAHAAAIAEDAERFPFVTIVLDHGYVWVRCVCGFTGEPHSVRTIEGYAMAERAAAQHVKAHRSGLGFFHYQDGWIYADVAAERLAAGWLEQRRQDPPMRGAWDDDGVRAAVRATIAAAS